MIFLLDNRHFITESIFDAFVESGTNKEENVKNESAFENTVGNLLFIFKLCYNGNRTDPHNRGESIGGVTQWQKRKQQRNLQQRQ